MRDWIRRYRPSPALVVSGVAVLIALGGTAIALPGRAKVDRNDLKRNVVSSKTIKNGTIQDADLNGAAISPRAYALVTGDGQVDEAQSRGVQDGDVSVNAGIFCFRNLGFQPKHLQATVNYLGGGGAVIGGVIGDSTLGCLFAEQAGIVMDGGANTTADFYVTFFD